MAKCLAWKGIGKTSILPAGYDVHNPQNGLERYAAGFCKFHSDTGCRNGLHNSDAALKAEV